MNEQMSLVTAVPSFHDLEKSLAVNAFDQGSGNESCVSPARSAHTENHFSNF